MWIECACHVGATLSLLLMYCCLFQRFKDSVGVIGICDDFRRQVRWVQEVSRSRTPFRWSLKGEYYVPRMYKRDYYFDKMP